MKSSFSSPKVDADSEFAKQHLPPIQESVNSEKADEAKKIREGIANLLQDQDDETVVQNSDPLSRTSSSSSIKTTVLNASSLNTDLPPVKSKNSSSAFVKSANPLPPISNGINSQIDSVNSALQDPSKNQHVVIAQTNDSNDGPLLKLLKWVLKQAGISAGDDDIVMTADDWSEIAKKDSVLKEGDNQLTSSGILDGFKGKYQGQYKGSFDENMDKAKNNISVAGAEKISDLNEYIKNKNLRLDLKYSDAQIYRGLKYSLGGEEHKISLIESHRSSNNASLDKMIGHQNELMSIFVARNLAGEENSALKGQVEKLINDKDLKYSDDNEEFSELRNYLKKGDQNAVKLKGYIDTRNQHIDGKKTNKDNCDILVKDQMDYAKLKVWEMESRGEYNKQIKETDKDITAFRDAILAQRNNERIFSVNKWETDISGYIKGEIDQFRVSSGNVKDQDHKGLNISGLEDAVEAIFDKMTDEKKSELYVQKGKHGKRI